VYNTYKGRFKVITSLKKVWTFPHVQWTFRRMEKLLSIM